MKTVQRNYKSFKNGRRGDWIPVKITPHQNQGRPTFELKALFTLKLIFPHHYFETDGGQKGNKSKRSFLQKLQQKEGKRAVFQNYVLLYPPST